MTNEQLINETKIALDRLWYNYMRLKDEQRTDDENFYLKEQLEYLQVILKILKGYIA